MFDAVILALEDFLSSINSGLKQGVGSYCRLQTCADADTIVADDGSLVSLFSISGNYQVVAEDKFETLVELFSTSMTPIFAHPGHAVQMVISYDEGLGRDEVYRIIQPTRITAQNLGLDIDSIIVDNADAVSRYTAWEGVFLAVWTRPAALAPSVRSQASTEMGKNTATGPLVRPLAQNIGKMMPQLKGVHIKATEAISSMLNACRMRYSKLNAHELIRVARMEVDRENTGSKWRASLPGDPLPVGYPEPGERDLSCVLYPSLAHQIFSREAEVLDRRSIRIGDKIHCPMTIELMPQIPQPFNVLFRALIAKHFPWRFSFLIEPDGIGGIALRSLLAGILAFSNSENKLFNAATKQLMESDDKPVRFSICLDTWVHVSTDNAVAQLRRNASTLSGLVQNWGACETAEVVGDPLLGVMGTIPAIMPASPARKSAAPLTDAVAMLPITRVTSPWETGSVLFRTPDGRVYPYEQGSSKQKAWVDVSIAPQGSGKSVLLNALNLGFVLQPGSGRFPFLSILDIGPSSKGLILTIQEGLPEDKKYLALFQRIRMQPEYSMNLFDTPIGFRKPHPKKKEFLKNMLSLLATPTDRVSPPDGIDGLAELCIEMAYDKLSDEQEPRLFDADANHEVGQLVNELALHIDKNTTWWEITDQLFENGYVHQAYIAQRYAVPLLSDVAAIAKEERVKRIYNSVIDGQSITDFFWRHLVEAIKSFCILKDPTQFDIGDAQIIALDLEEVCPRGSAAADRQTLIMFMMGRDITTSRFFFQQEDAQMAPQLYRDYHIQRTEAVRQDPKRLVFDEVHRYIKYEAITRQISIDIREGRKWNVAIGMATQDTMDYPEELLKLVSTMFVLGANTRRTLDDLAMFGLNHQCQEAIMRIGRPDHRGSKLVAKFVTDEDAQQVLMLTIGPQFIWATSTTAEDMSLRNSLIAKLGQKKALQLLAKCYPQGTVKKVLEQRRQEVELNEFGKAIDLLRQVEAEILAEYKN